MIYYATRSHFKQEELRIIEQTHSCSATDGARVAIGDVVEFHFSSIATEEPLSINLDEMVRHKARSAYRAVLAPCVVEHAGLVLERHADVDFPGGLTQPMWDSLGHDGFLQRLDCRQERAIARAVIGYCDGMKIYTFSGETCGEIATEARGDRSFYWDTIFCPDGGGGKTYAEISGEPCGLRRKLELSQSAKAIEKFVTFLTHQSGSSLFEA